MRKALVAIIWILTFTFANANVNEHVTCAIEDAACEFDVSYEDLISFLVKKELDINNISNPDLYAVSYAWLNTPYRYGGNSKNGIDCSRFAAMLQQAAMDISHSGGSSGDLYKMGIPVERKELKEGDLVFFTIKAGRISHVGVYLQNGKFAHSSTSKGVIISDLSEDYWNRYFYKGARLQTFDYNPF